MRKITLIFATLMAISSCSKPANHVSEVTSSTSHMALPAPHAPSEGGEISRAVSQVDAAADAVAPAATDAAAQSEKIATPSNSAAIAIKPMLAYAYSISLLLPQDKVASQMQAHQAACTAAGNAKCQILNANISNDETSKSANLTLRAEPVWLASFRGGLDSDARKAGGRIRASETTSEDLTRNIVDTEARLRAQTTLRTRIEAIIASRPGKLSDVLEAERELARVQGEIDSDKSNLEAMRGRVDMSMLNLSYSSRPDAVNNGAMEPLKQAFLNFFGVVAGSLAAIIYFIGAILPFAVIFGPMAWFGWKFLRKNKARNQANKEKTAD